MAKRGQADVTTSTFSEVFFAIIAIVIVVIFIGLKFFPEIVGQSDEEICRLSILTRATSPDATQRLLPLKCTSKKICLSLNGEDCPQFAGEKDIVKVKLPKNTENAANIIEKTTADSWYTCWSMTGKGKLQIFPKGDSGSDVKDLISDLTVSTFSSQAIKPKCIICSRIALSRSFLQLDKQNPTEEEKQAKEILGNVDINGYIKNTQVPGSTETYLETMTDKQFSTFPQEFSQQLGQKSYNTTDQIGIVFMQVLVGKNTPTEEAIRAGSYSGLAIGGTLLSTPLGKVTSFLPGGPIAGAGITAVGSLISGASAYYKTEQNQALAVLHCGKLVGSEEEAKSGCSIVTPMDFNNDAAINSFCSGGIEGTI